MYTRNYYETDESTAPSGYDGIAMRKEEREPYYENEDTKAFAPSPTNEPKGGGIEGLLSGIFGKLHIGIPSLDKIGYEEILILGVAAFLLFSADGDKECALILLLLLLIN